jgi:hypothetical protein
MVLIHDQKTELVTVENRKGPLTKLEPAPDIQLGCVVSTHWACVNPFARVDDMNGQCSHFFVHIYTLLMRRRFTHTVHRGSSLLKMTKNAHDYVRQPRRGPFHKSTITALHNIFLKQASAGSHIIFMNKHIGKVHAYCTHCRGFAAGSLTKKSPYDYGKDLRGAFRHLRFLLCMINF